MSFIRIRTRKNRRYLYRETRWREGRRVRSRSDYLGPLGGSGPSRPFEEAQDRAMAVAERHAAQVEAYQRAEFGETAQERSHREHREHLDRLHADYGLKLGPSNPAASEPLQSAVTSEPGLDQTAAMDQSDDAVQDTDTDSGGGPGL
jgi:hypothetical protein